MPLKNRLLLGSLLVIVAALLALIFAPLMVSNSLRFWIGWKARQQKLTVKIAKIEAPLFRPVVIHGFHLTSAPAAPFHVDLTATRAAIDLNLKSILLRLRGRAIRALAVDGLRAEMHRNQPGLTLTESGWNTLQRLLPDNFNCDRIDLRVEDGSTVLLFRNVSLSASQIEAGRFSAGEVMIVSPWFRQTFSGLRGSTNWQSDRLTVAGVSLTRGLDVQSITGDLSHLGKQRIGLEFDLDTFGGKIRARISNEWRSRHSNWNMAGSATGISLPQTSEALGFTDHIGGTLPACKFTFRGDIRDPISATASLWTELNGLTWRGRTAEIIMLGASLYNRQIQLQQLYVKQHENQLTLSGEGVLPSKAADWLSPDFRGDVSASIDDLGSFAALFGANPGNFAGEMTIEGTMNTRDRKLGGHLTLGGASLTIFNTVVDALTAKLILKSPELQIEQLELKRKNDSLRAEGKIDLAKEHDYSGTLNASINNVAEYFAILGGPAPSDAKPTSAEIESTIKSGIWDVRGVVNIPASSPVNFSGKLSLPIGTDWNEFLTTRISLTLDFPAISLANVPRCFSHEIFRDGTLSGKFTFSESLQHPDIVGEVELTNGKLQATLVNLTEVSGKVTFNGGRASIDALNAAATDIQLSLRGEIHFRNSNDIVMNLVSADPLFDLTSTSPGCVRSIEFARMDTARVPAVTALEFRGGIFRNPWLLGVTEPGKDQSTSATDETIRRFELCPGKNSEDNRLKLGVRRAVKPEKPQKREKR